MRLASSVPGELIPCAFVWLDPGITPCRKSLRTPANSDSGDSMDWVMEAGMISSLFGSIDPSRK